MSQIYALIELAAEQIALVKEGLDIVNTLEPLRRQSRISETGIFMTIIDVNRQLNVLLDELIQPSDVFSQVALVNSFAASIIENLGPGADPTPLPKLNGHRSPADVYGKLLQCLDLVGEISSPVEGASICQAPSEYFRRRYFNAPSFLSINRFASRPCFDYQHQTLCANG